MQVAISVVDMATIVNNELSKIHEWLCANRLSLIASISPIAKKVANTISLHLINKRISETKSIKYLGVLID